MGGQYLNRLKESQDYQAFRFDYWLFTVETRWKNACLFILLKLPDFRLSNLLLAFTLIARLLVDLL